ncbi:hypothetical protein PWG15_32885 (plasmid) [Ensifer adhaerens]|nr:hypothetical protein [Ensifer adhaerens]WDZ81725.1 hypothetical protein PWG15_32885 [Ensifer adhaerens]
MERSQDADIIDQFWKHNLSASLNEAGNSAAAQKPGRFNHRRALIAAG